MDSGLSYLALGDSYTIGESVAAAQRWPNQLASKLRTRGLNLNDPQIIAATGWTTDELATGMDRVNLKHCYALVSLLIGVNNQYRGRDLDNYRQEFGELLHRAIDLAGAKPQRVFVLSIPDWSVTPFGHAAGRDLDQEALALAAYNQAKCEIAEAADVLYFDITPSTLEAAHDDALLANDGLHPTRKLYAIWVENIIDGVQALIKTKSGC